MSPVVELDVKRFYLKGVVLRSACPGCGTEVTRDLGRDYLSEPTLNQDEQIEMYHHDCPADGAGTEWKVTIRLDLSVVGVEGVVVEYILLRLANEE